MNDKLPEQMPPVIVAGFTPQAINQLGAMLFGQLALVLAQSLGMKLVKNESDASASPSSASADGAGSGTPSTTS